MYTVSPPHTNLQVVNSLNSENMCSHVRSCELVHALSRACILQRWLCFFVLNCTVLYRVQQYSIFISSPGFLEASIEAAVTQLVLFKVLDRKSKNVFFLYCLFVFYYLCEKYYHHITVQYYTADCVNWVPGLTLLGLQTNWIYNCTLGTELVQMQGTYCRSNAL